MGEGETAPVLMYGNFITAVINFLVTAFAIFCLIKVINTVSEKFAKTPEPAAPAAPTTKKCPYFNGHFHTNYLVVSSISFIVSKVPCSITVL